MVDLFKVVQLANGSPEAADDCVLAVCAAVPWNPGPTELPPSVPYLMSKET